MAFIQGQQDENDPLNQGQGQNPLVSGQGSNSVGQAVSQGGAPAGGGGGWTNIQAYLKANEGNSGSAQALTNAAQSQFGQEREKMTGDATKFQSDAESEVKNKSIDNQQADDLIKQSGQQYSWGGQQNDAYQGNVKKAQDFLTGSYSGPRDYTYGLSADTQKFGEGAKDNNAFDSLMGRVYNQGAGRPLSSGQFQLQKQFDVNNEALANARQKLGTDYDALSGERDNLVKSTTDNLKGLESTFRNNQARFRDYLGLKQNELDTNIAKQENDARAAYQNTLGSQSGRKSAAEPAIAAMPSSLQDSMAGALSRRGIWGDLTWNQLQREANILNGSGPDAYRVYYNVDPYLQQNKDALNSFYGQQDQLYGQTADNEERQYNAILDFLGMANGKKAEGFKVRG